MHSLLKFAETTGAVIVASSLFLAGTCSSNLEPPLTPTTPSAAPSEKSSGTAGSTAGFMGISTLPGSIQDFTPATAKDVVGSCVESDDSKPIIFNNESVCGFTCVMAVGDGDATIFNAAEDPATVSRINEKAESVENCVPYEPPSRHAFSGVNKDSPFAVVIDKDNRIYQEFVFADINADATRLLTDEIVRDFQQS